MKQKQAQFVCRCLNDNHLVTSICGLSSNHHNVMVIKTGTSTSKFDTLSTARKSQQINSEKWRLDEQQASPRSRIEIANFGFHGEEAR